MNTTLKRNKLNSRIMFLGFLFMMPGIIMILFTYIIPLIWNIVLSFCKWNGNSTMEFVGLKNYRSIFTQRALRSSIINSLFIGLVSTAFAMVIGVFLALCIYRLSKRGSSFCRFVFFSPSMLPMTVIGLLFTFILAEDNGLLNNILRLLGLGSLETAWLSNKKTVLWVLSFVQGWKNSGTVMMLCATAMIGIPASLFEVSKLAGASYLQEIRYIILPLIKPTIKLSLSIILLASFKTYDIVWTLTKGGPGDLSMTAPIKMISTAFSFNKYGLSAAIGVVLTILVGICILIGRRIARGETYEY